MVRSRRAWLYVLSIAALVVPAGGIAYLGAVSYRDERGAVSAQTERQREAALGAASRIGRAITAALDAADRAVTAGAGAGSMTPATARLDPPLARYWFWIDAQHQLRVPRPALPGGELAGGPGGVDRGASCSGRIEDCMRELSTRQARVAKLAAAERAEATGNFAEARRGYTALAASADTGPAALLGLARVMQRTDDGRAADAVAELDRRFGDRSFDGVPAGLAAATVLAEGRRDPAARIGELLAIADRVVAGGYAMAPVIELGVLDQLRAQLAPPLTDEQTHRLAAIDGAISELRSEARATAGLAVDLAEIESTAAPAWRGLPEAHQPARTLIYRRRGDGGVIGIAVDAAMLEAAAKPATAATDDIAPLASAARVIVLATGSSPAPGLRTIQQVPLGAALPHLGVAIVNPLGEPDPLDEVIRARSQRHVIVTSALAIALGLGLLATIRGAARARELAQLKSDFVSTVSHELKTPLTSIRMFAEMLEQGVANDDPAKLSRYHGVIIKESERLGALIANLLDYAQIEKGTRRYTQTREPVAPLARHAVTTFATAFAAPGDPGYGDGDPRNRLAVAVSDQAMSAEVEVDRDVVIGAVLNLLANARKYGGADQPIEVAVDADPAAAWISVRDRGPGIPRAEQARIFREFYRAPEAYRSRVEGTGLGLALVKRHIEALGGSVEVASEVGEGATFTIRLPRAASEVG